MTIVEFLRARLDDDHQHALAMPERARRWSASGGWIQIGEDSGSLPTTGYVYDAEVDSDDVAEHIARHDPARVLREVEAKRRIVDLVVTGPDGEPAYYDGYAEAWRDALRLLALPYSDHPDYDPTWSPT